MIINKIKRVKKRRNLLKIRKDKYPNLKESKDIDGYPMYNVEFLKKVLRI